MKSQCRSCGRTSTIIEFKNGLCGFCEAKGGMPLAIKFGEMAQHYRSLAVPAGWKLSETRYYRNCDNDGNTLVFVFGNPNDQRTYCSVANIPDTEFQDYGNAVYSAGYEAFQAAIKIIGTEALPGN